MDEEEFYKNSEQQKSSIFKSLLQLNEALISLSCVLEQDRYRENYGTFSLKDMVSSGLPVDAFRQFINSQETRLSNQLTSISSVPEKIFFVNLKTIYKQQMNSINPYSVKHLVFQKKQSPVV